MARESGTKFLQRNSCNHVELLPDCDCKGEKKMKEQYRDFYVPDIYLSYVFQRLGASLLAPEACCHFVLGQLCNQPAKG